MGCAPFHALWGVNKVSIPLGVSNSLSDISLPRCVVPPLQVLNPVVTFGRCLLKFPYRQMLTLVNDSDLAGCYRVLPQVWHRIRLLPSIVINGFIEGVGLDRGLDKALRGLYSLFLRTGT